MSMHVNGSPGEEDDSLSQVIFTNTRVRRRPRRQKEYGRKSCSYIASSHIQLEKEIQDVEYRRSNSESINASERTNVAVDLERISSTDFQIVRNPAGDIGSSTHSSAKEFDKAICSQTNWDQNHETAIDFPRQKHLDSISMDIVSYTEEQAFQEVTLDVAKDSAHPKKVERAGNMKGITGGKPEHIKIVDMPSISSLNVSSHTDGSIWGAPEKQPSWIPRCVIRENSADIGLSEGSSYKSRSDIDPSDIADAGNASLSVEERNICSTNSACLALRHTSGNFSSEKSYGHPIEHAIVDMLAHMSDEKIVAMHLRTLSKTYGDTEYHDIIRESHGLSACIAAMKAHAADDVVHVLCCRVLRSICKDCTDTRLLLAREGGLQHILKMLQRKRLPLPHVISEALLAICQCCKDCDVAQTLCALSGGAEAVLRVMRKEKHSAQLQRLCLDALGVFSIDNPENVDLICENGGVLEVLSAMRQDRSDVDVQLSAMRVLRHMCSEQPGLQSAIGLDGGVFDVLEALRQHVDNEEAVDTACSCLRYLAFSLDNRRLVAQNDGVAVILNAAERFKTSASAIQKISLALSNVVCDDTVNKTSVVKCGGVSTIVSVMSIHVDVTDILECACRVLRNVSDSRPSTKRMCFKQGAIHGVIAAMTNNGDVAGIQEHGAAMLINMMPIFANVIVNMQIDNHLETVCDIHSLSTSTFIQLNHLRSELDAAAKRSVRGFFMKRSKNSRKPTPNCTDQGTQPEGRQGRDHAGMHDSAPQRSLSRGPSQKMALSTLGSDVDIDGGRHDTCENEFIEY